MPVELTWAAANDPKPGPVPVTPPGSTSTVAVKLTVKLPVAPAYFPVPPVKTPEPLPTTGNGGVPEDKSAHWVSEVAWVYSRSPLGSKRKTAASPTNLNSVPAFGTPPGSVQLCPSGVI